MLWLAAPLEKMKQVLYSDWPLERKDWPISPTRDCPLKSRTSKKLHQADLQK